MLILAELETLLCTAKKHLNDMQQPTNDCCVKVNSTTYKFYN